MTKQDPQRAEIARQMAVAVYAKVRVPDMPPTFDEAGAQQRALVMEVVEAALGVVEEMGLRVQTKEQEAADRRQDKLVKAIEEAVAGVSVVPVTGEAYEETLIRRVKTWGTMFTRRRDRPA